MPTADDATRCTVQVGSYKRSSESNAKRHGRDVANKFFPLFAKSHNNCSIGPCEPVNRFTGCPVCAANPQRRCSAARGGFWRLRGPTHGISPRGQTLGRASIISLNAQKIFNAPPRSGQYRMGKARPAEESGNEECRSLSAQ